MFGRWKKFKNEISADEQARENKARDEAARGLAAKFNLDRDEVKTAYDGKPQQLIETFREASSAARWRVYSAIGTVAALGSVVRLRQLALLLVVGAVTGYFYNQKRLNDAQDKVARQLEDHRHSDGPKPRPPKPG